MKFRQLYSCSDGNVHEVAAASGRRLIIECGTSWKRMQKTLNYNLLNVDGCLLTHEHGDHAAAAGDVLAAGISIYASKGTLAACGQAGAHNACIVKPGEVFQVGEFQVLGFNVNHDAAEPLGFVVYVDDEYLLFVTDTSHIPCRFNYQFSEIAIECSYDKDVLSEQLEAGEIIEPLAKRLLFTHMEKSTALRYLKEFCNLSKCRTIHLVHMSGRNIDKRAAKKEFESQLFIETRIVYASNQQTKPVH